MDEFYFAKDIVEFLAYLSAIIGIPLWVVNYYRIKKKEQKEREYLIYNSLDEKYINYLQLCIEHPHLDVFTPSVKKKELEELDQKREYLLIGILISIFERAFILYYNESTNLQKNQWHGWKIYIDEWIICDTFVYVWNDMDGCYDRRFVMYMDKLIEVSKLKSE